MRRWLLRLYPIYLVVLLAALSHTLFIKVPALASMLEQSGNELPALTRLTLACGLWLEGNPVFAAAILAVAFVAGLAARKSETLAVTIVGVLMGALGLTVISLYLPIFALAGSIQP